MYKSRQQVNDVVLVIVRAHKRYSELESANFSPIVGTRFSQPSASITGASKAQFAGP